MGMQQLLEKESQIEEHLQISRVELQESYADHNEDGASLALANKFAAEQQLQQIRSTLAKAKTMERKKATTVALGSTVHLHTRDGERVFTLVDTMEVDPLENRISPESPLGHQLMGHHAGDKIKLNIPGSKLSFKITKVD